LENRRGACNKKKKRRGGVRGRKKPKGKKKKKNRHKTLTSLKFPPLDNGGKRGKKAHTGKTTVVAPIPLENVVGPKEWGYQER